VVLALELLLDPGASQAEADHSKDLHFSHPLFGESPSPDTKVRADYFFKNEAAEATGESHTARFLAEYALRRWASIEASIPFTVRDPDHESSERHLDTVEIALKLASFAFSEQGLLLGGGLELGLPTGDSSKEIGSSHIVEVEPFLDFGLKRGDLELTGFLSAGIPTNENGDDEADVELGWNASLLYHFYSRVELLLEFNGERVFGGEEAGHSSAVVAPGLKLAPMRDQKLKIGVGVGLPISNDKDFDALALVSVFYHF
jgi:hypothetical protein